MAEEGWQLSSLIKGVHLRFLPTSKQMQNITSKQMLTRCAVESGNQIRAVRDAQTKKKLYDELTPISKFLGDLREAAAPANTTGGSTGGTTGGNTGGNTGGDNGGNTGGGGTGGDNGGDGDNGGGGGNGNGESGDAE